MTSTPGSSARPDPLQPVLADLAELDGADPAGQVPLYERMHAALADALNGTVEQPGQDAGGR